MSVNPIVLPPDYLHELRTPLNQIIGYSELLAEQAEEEGHSSFVPDLKKILSAGRQLLALLNGTLPNEADPKAGIEAVLSPAAEPGPAQILLVDDNPMNLDLLSRRLEREGHSTTKAVNGLDALAMMRSRSFDLVLLDIMMPVMDGYQVLEALKADESLRQVPVVMISALDEVESVARCVELGADDFLTKPFNPILLKARIHASLEKKRAHDREKQLYQQLQKNYARLLDLEKLRDDLTQMVIHDLRTPLTSVISGMQTLDGMGNLSDEQREMTAIAIAGGDKLLTMINELLEVAKMESGNIPLDYMLLDAEELISSVVRQLGPLLEENRLKMRRRTVGQMAPFLGDEAMLRRVLSNLLGNAIKFTAPGGTLTVTAEASDDHRSVVFSVSDTGKGIPKEAFERIFEKFGQVDSRNERSRSSGLGLTFCKLVVNAHGGEIWVESSPGEGSKFAFSIPLAAVRQNQVAGELSASRC